MNLYHTWRRLRSLMLIIVLLVPLLGLQQAAWADGPAQSDPNAPPPQVASGQDVPKPAAASPGATTAPAAAGKDASQTTSAPPPVGQAVDQPKSQTPGGGDKTASTAATPAWSVSLTSSNYSPQVNQNFTLTATTNRSVSSPSPYFIQIYLGTTRYASCGTGTSCSVTLYGTQAHASYTFQARIALSNGSSVQAYSNSVTVGIYAPWTVSLASSSTNPSSTQSVTLTATANQSVSLAPYYIQIYIGTSRLVSCGIGTSCPVIISGLSAGSTYSFQARIALLNGTSVQAWSSVVTVTVQTASLNVPLLSQRDTRWANTLLGNNTSQPNNIGNLGCFITSLAMVFNFYQSGFTDPGRLNTALKQHQGFTNGGFLVWGSVGSSPIDSVAPTGVKYRGTDTSWTHVNQELANRHPVLVQVYSSGSPNNSTSSHMVVLTGRTSNGGYTINDPWNGTAYTWPNGALSGTSGYLVNTFRYVSP